MLELFASPTCPFCAELREKLEWDGEPFVEYDVDSDAAARKRLFDLAGPQAIVPVLVEGGRVTQIGWQGRGCAIAPG